MLDNVRDLQELEGNADDLYMDDMYYGNEEGYIDDVYEEDDGYY